MFKGSNYSPASRKSKYLSLKIIQNCNCIPFCNIVASRDPLTSDNEFPTLVYWTKLFKPHPRSIVIDMYMYYLFLSTNQAKIKSPSQFENGVGKA